MTSTLSANDIEAKVLEAIEELGGPEASTISSTTTFEDIDVDSLDLVELGQIMEEQLEVTLETSDISELKTIADAVELVRRYAT
jgi:acyl carrier protein